MADDLVQRDEVELGGPSHGPLVTRAAGEPVELRALHSLHRHAVVGGEAGQGVELRVVSRAALDEDLLELGPSRADRLTDGLQPADEPTHARTAAGGGAGLVQRIASATARGSAASRMGLPTTSQFAPSAAALAAVATRF